MKILVFGGTRFVGHAIVGALIERGHDVTLFNRGNNPGEFPDLARITGDRNNINDLAAVSTGGWDVVVDANGYTPQQARDTCAVLRNVSRYIFISTVSVYDQPQPGTDEDGPLVEVGEDVGATDKRAYGGLKVLCERELRERFDERLTVLRPTIVIGPRDYTNRFSWWIERIATGVAIPRVARATQPIQLIDAADLAAFAVDVAERDIAGNFNTLGPAQPLTLATMVTAIEDALRRGVIWSDPDKSQSPMVLPPDGSEDGLFSVDGSSAYRAGLTLRPLGESIRDIVHSQSLER